MLRRRVFGAALLAATLCGCAVVDKVEPRYDSVNRATAGARNDSILLNIVRASHDEPLNFIAFSKISGQTQAGVSAGLPQFLLGPTPATGFIENPGRDAVFGSSSLNTSTSASNSFDISLLESKDFYNALLRPVGLPTLNYFIRQGYSRQLLFWLFADSVEETIGGKTYGYRFTPGKDAAYGDQFNAANDGGCNRPFGVKKCFGDLVDIAYLTGLTVETKTVSGGAGGGSSRAGGLSTYGRFCFDPVASKEAVHDMDPARIHELKHLIWSTRLLPRCRSAWPDKTKRGSSAGRELDTLEFTQPGTPVGTVKYRIVTRSTFGIYQFLGRLLAKAAANEVSLVGNDGDDHLLTIVKGGAPGCFNSISYFDGEYCVPSGAVYTKQIIQLLAQLLALQTQSGDLAITPTVRVTP